MAFSRLEKIGNIYSRVSGLLRAGAMKWEDRPLFYDIYTAFPPLKEIKYMDEAPKLNVRKIFYEEDTERAERDYNMSPAFDMNERQRFIRLDTKRTFREKLPLTSATDEKETHKGKLFDLQSLDLEKN